MDKIKRFWLASGSIILLNVIGYLTLKGDALLYFSDLLPVICSFIAIVGIGHLLKSFKEFDLTKAVWLLILVGLVFNFLAEGIYSFLEIILKKDMNDLFPSPADYFWVAAYIFFFISLFLMLSSYIRTGLPLGKIRSYFMLIIVLACIVIVIINFLLVPIIEDTETSLATKIVSIFYPVADILIASLAVILMYISNQFDNKLISMPWKIMALGFFCFTISDLVYSYLSWIDKYDSGNFIDIGWNLGYLLLGISGLYQLKLMKSIQ